MIKHLIIMSGLVAAFELTGFISGRKKLKDPSKETETVPAIKVSFYNKPMRFLAKAQDRRRSRAGV